jgi:fibronectin-binding autotransporter adhesin
MGRSGTWLLDPRNVAITNTTADGTFSANVFHPTANDATIDVAAITAALNVGTSVEIMTGTAGAQAGNITVGTAIAKTAGGNATLTLNAAGAIYVYNAISSTAGQLGLNLWSGGNIEVTAAVTTNNGAVTTGGTNGIGTAGGYFNNIAAINTGTANITLNHAGNIALDNSVNTSGIVTLSTAASISQNVAITGSGSLVVGGTGAVTLLNPGNEFGSITLNRAAATSSVSLRTSITPNVQASSIGTGQFTLTGQGFTQSGTITQAAGGGTVTIAGGTGTVTLSQANAWTGAVTVTGGVIDIAGQQTATGGGSLAFNATKQVAISSNILASGDISIWGNAPSGDPSMGINTVGDHDGVKVNASVLIDAGGGNIDIAGRGGDSQSNYGVRLLGGHVFTSGNGSISIKGHGGSSATGGSLIGVGLISETYVKTQHGALAINGVGSPGTSGGYNSGVFVYDSRIEATGDGSIALTGLGGASTTSESIYIAGSEIVSAGNGAIVLTAAVPSGGGTGLAFVSGGPTNAVEIGGGAFQGNLELRADTVATSATSLSLSRNAGGGTIILRPYNNSTSIGLNGGSGSLSIAGTILNSIQGFSILQLGSGSQTGDIQIDNTTFSQDLKIWTEGSSLTNSLSLESRNLTIIADLGYTQGAGEITTTGTVTFGGSGSVVANNSTNMIGTLVLEKAASTAAVSIVNSTAINLGTSTMGTGALSLTGNGFSQTGGLTQDALGGAVSISGGANAVTFGQANTWTGDLSASGSTVSVLAAQALAREGLQTVGLTSTTGNVLVQGNLTKTGTGGANISIQAPETAWFNNAGITSGGGNITIWGNAPGGSNTAGANAGTAWGVRLDSAGAVLNSGAGNISIVGKGSTDSTGQHGLVMLGGASIQSTSGTITLQGRGGDGIGAGSQGIIVGTGAIQTQTGTISITGWGGTNSATAHGITVDTTSSIVASAGASITLNGTGANGGSGLNFMNAPTLNSGTGGLSLTSNGGLSLAAATLIATGNTTLTGGAGAITATNANNRLTGAVTFSNSAGNVSLLTAAGYGLTLGESITAGDLIVASGSTLSQIGALNVGGTTTLTASGGITLTGAGNQFTGAVISTSGGGGSIQLSGTSLTLGTTNAAGNLILSTTGGGINQTGLLTVNGNLTSSTTGGPLGLSTYNNVVAGSVSLAASGGSNIAWSQSGPLLVGSIDASGTLNVSVTGGAFSQVGAITTAGAATISADTGNVTLTNASNAFGGPLTLSAASGSASISTAGPLSIATIDVADSLALTAGGTITQSGAIQVGTGTASLSATGTITLSNSLNSFGSALALTGVGGAIQGTAPSPGAVTAVGNGFTFNGAAIGNRAPASPGNNEGSTLTTVTTETLAQIITQILTSTVVQPSSSTTGTTDAANVNPVSPAAVQAMLIAILAEAASPAGGTGGSQQGGGDTGNNNVQQSGGQTGGAPGTTPNPAAGTDTFAAGTTITINTSGGTVQSITVTPVGGGAPVTILPGLLNLTPPAIPTAASAGTPGISGNFPLSWRR